MKTSTVVIALILALGLAVLFAPFALATSSKLSNGLWVDSSGNLLINAGGGTAYPISLGLNLDSSGNVLVNCQFGCAGSGTSVSVAGGSALTSANLNATTPAAQSNFLNCTFQNSTTNVSVECPSGTSSSTFALGNVLNGLTISATTGTLTLANSKTFTVNNSLTLAGTDGTTMTFPGSSDTVATLAATQALTNKTVNGLTVTSSTGTLTLANSKTFTVNNTLTLAGTDSTTMTFPSTSVTVAGNATATAHTFGLYEGTSTAQNLLSCGAGTTVSGNAGDPTCTATLTLGVQNSTQATLTLAGGSSANPGQLILNIAGSSAFGSTIQPGANSAATVFTLPVGAGTGETLVAAAAALTSSGICLGQGGGYIACSNAGIASSAGTKFTTYNSETTAGAGMVYERGVTSQAAETTTAATILTVTPASAVGTYRVNCNASVTTATSGVVGFTLSWTDSEGNAQSNVALSSFTPGTAAPALTFTTSAAGNYSCAPFTFDVNNAGAAITLKWVGGGTISAKVSGIIERLQ
jgi:hypothetical protein